MSSTTVAALICFTFVATLINMSSAGVVPAVPAAAAAYVNAVPYNVPPHGSSVNIVQRGLAAPYVASPYAPYAAAPYVASPYAPYAASPYVASPYASYAAAPYVASPYAPYAPYYAAPYNFPASAYPVATPILK